MADAVQLTYRDETGAPQTVGAVDAGRIDFARVEPSRAFPSYRGQRNFPGHYMAECSRRMIEFESWLERDEAMAMDHDPLVEAFAAQPFLLEWVDHTGRCKHTPDFFARRRDGTCVVVDCRPEDRIAPRDRELFDGTAQICATLGWEFRLVHRHDPVWLANAWWLAGYRLTRFRIEPIASALLLAAADPCPLVWAAAQVGEPIAVLPVLYHLLWRGDLQANLNERLDGLTVVRTA